MKELIERLEKATGPDVALDRWIWWATLKPEVKESVAGPYARGRIDSAAHPGKECGQFYDSSNPGCIATLSECSRFTGSLDAAMTLVQAAIPGKYRPFVQIEFYANGTGNCGIHPWWKKTRDDEIWSKEMATPILAVCKAALKAFEVAALNSRSVSEGKT